MTSSSRWFSLRMLRHAWFCLVLVCCFHDMWGIMHCVIARGFFDLGTQKHRNKVYFYQLLTVPSSIKFAASAAPVLSSAHEADGSTIPPIVLQDKDDLNTAATSDVEEESTFSPYSQTRQGDVAANVSEQATPVARTTAPRGEHETSLGNNHGASSPDTINNDIKEKDVKRSDGGELSAPSWEDRVPDEMKKFVTSVSEQLRGLTGGDPKAEQFLADGVVKILNGESPEKVFNSKDFAKNLLGTPSLDDLFSGSDKEMMEKRFAEFKAMEERNPGSLDRAQYMKNINEYDNLEGGNTNSQTGGKMPDDIIADTRMNQIQQKLQPGNSLSDDNYAQNIRSLLDGFKDMGLDADPESSGAKEGSLLSALSMLGEERRGGITNSLLATCAVMAGTLARDQRDAFRQMQKIANTEKKLESLDDLALLQHITVCVNHIKPEEMRDFDKNRGRMPRRLLDIIEQTTDLPAVVQTFDKTLFPELKQILTTLTEDVNTNSGGPGSNSASMIGGPMPVVSNWISVIGFLLFTFGIAALGRQFQVSILEEKQSGKRLVKQKLEKNKDKQRLKRR